MYRVHMIVSGLVQGVGFRYTTQQRAKEIGVYGWVRNLSDGTVEVEAEGDSKKVDQFIEMIKKGPRRFITIDNVQITTYSDIKDYSSFDIV
ncbi:acylphosphatase [Aquibacillus albus]|uniref:Acylphosphatase n=1 Tax=Aquibacillus albus TaxID=1168171 RepID=A0ABS2MVS9_9BACI|nr:acylphosphatase [Aquibacillus albus]MBM7569898.1 acylphosphatase [Aquibacillus albus]